MARRGAEALRRKKVKGGFMVLYAFAAPRPGEIQIIPRRGAETLRRKKVIEGFSASLYPLWLRDLARYK